MPDGIRAVKLPKWGLSMTEGTVVAWYAKAGDHVKAGSDLVEIETPKITNLYESPASGLLRRCVAQVGETLPVGALLDVMALVVLVLLPRVRAVTLTTIVQLLLYTMWLWRHVCSEGGMLAPRGTLDDYEVEDENAVAWRRIGFPLPMTIFSFGQEVTRACSFMCTGIRADLCFGSARVGASSRPDRSLGVSLRPCSGESNRQGAPGRFSGRSIGETRFANCDRRLHGGGYGRTGQSPDHVSTGSSP